MKYNYKNYGSNWKYAIFLIKDNSVRFYCWANTKEVIQFFTSENTYNVKWFTRLLNGKNALEIENKKDSIIEGGL